jgi:hypothetical protein
MTGPRQTVSLIRKFTKGVKTSVWVVCTKEEINAEGRKPYATHFRFQIEAVHHEPSGECEQFESPSPESLRRQAHGIPPCLHLTFVLGKMGKMVGKMGPSICRILWKVRRGCDLRPPRSYAITPRDSVADGGQLLRRPRQEYAQSQNGVRRPISASPVFSNWGADGPWQSLCQVAGIFQRPLPFLSTNLDGLILADSNSEHVGDRFR